MRMMKLGGQKGWLLLAGGVHLTLITVISLRDTASIFSEGGNLFPRSSDRAWAEACRAASLMTGQKLSSANPVREGITLYLNATGISGGYAFFAPNVPSTYKLIFELHYPEGRVEYLLPQVRSRAVGLRLVSLFDYISRAGYLPLRELIFRVIARSVSRSHPDATSIRTVFGYVDPPSPEEFQHGEAEVYQFLYAYDFHPRAKTAKRN